MSWGERLRRLIPVRSTHKAPEAALEDWPLPAPAMVLLLATPAPLPIQCRETRPGDTIFAFPFDFPKLAEWFSPRPSLDPAFAHDGKYCEHIGADGSREYFACRAMIRALAQAETQAGRGMARLRWVACDRFEYVEEAAQLYAEFEAELGPAKTAAGLARVLLRQHPGRALELIRSAEQRGLGCASITACAARVLLGCGQVPQAVQAAARALQGPPDPVWAPADHIYSWSILHGGAMASSVDPSLREDVIDAIRSLSESFASAHRSLACAALFEIAGDTAAAVRCGETALARAADDGKLRADVEALLQRARLAATAVSPAPPDSAAPDDRAVLDVRPAFEGPDLTDIWAVRDYCQRLAEKQGAGLVDADVAETAGGRAIRLIYKRRRGSGYVFTCMQIVPKGDATDVWTVEADEGSHTGTREAVVTAHLMEHGDLDIGSFKSSWARDPFDSTYRGVDPSVLRFMSDDPVYDRMFPRHPLSRVRRALRQQTP